MLVCCLLMLSTVGFAETVSHTLHHAHHGANTHATPLCSWLCAAGQGLNTSIITVPSNELPQMTFHAAAMVDVREPVGLPAISRAPPSARSRLTV